MNCKRRHRPVDHTAESHHAEARERLAGFDRPVVSYSFSDDGIAPKRAVEHLLGWLSNRRTDSSPPHFDVAVATR